MQNQAIQRPAFTFLVRNLYSDTYVRTTSVRREIKKKLLETLSSLKLIKSTTRFNRLIALFMMVE